MLCNFGFSWFGFFKRGGNVLTISLPNAATTEKSIQKLEDEIAKLKAGKEGELKTDEVKKSLYFEDDESAKLKTKKVN